MASGGSLADLTAAEAVAHIRSRRASSLELVEDLVRNIERSDPELGAWEIVDSDAARAEAQRCDGELRRGEARGALFGVPFGVKDVIDVVGLPTKAGFEPFTNRIPQVDAAVVASMKRNGGIVLGKTVTAQLAYADPPRTLNPWSRDRSPGGSSSGSGAAVAARQVPMALATQTGGSTLRPAAFTGCVGFKPSYGLIDVQGVFPLAWSLDHVGVITRSVEDCRLFLASTTSRDQSRVRRAPRLGLISDAMAAASSEVRASVDSAIARFVAEGAVLVDVRLEVSLEEMWAIHQVIMQSEAAAAHWHLLPAHRVSYEPRMRSFLELGGAVPAAAYIHAQRLRRRARGTLEAAAKLADALILPTTSTIAPDRESTGDSSLQAIFSLTGLPAITIPIGLSRDGLPLAVQLATGRRNDWTLLDVAQWCSDVMGPLPAPPPRTTSR